MFLKNTACYATWMRSSILFLGLLLVTGWSCKGEPPRPEPRAPALPTAPASQPASEAPPPRRPSLSELHRSHTVVLVSHPQPHVLRAFQRIVKAGALAPAGKPLALVGVRHADEQESYRRSAKLARRLPWLHLRTLRCPLGPAQLFQENGCTARFRALLRDSDAMVFTGGADIPPTLFGQKTRLTTVIRTPQRQYWEISLLFHMLGRDEKGFKPLLADRPDYPVLGICMGMQAMNVATGGTLHQDVLWDLYNITTFEDAMARLKPDQLHRNPRHYLQPAPGTRPGVFHRLRYTGAQELWQALGADNVAVMSIHHQSVDRPGKGLEVIATSSDGKVVEAVRHRRFPHVLGVQFHPEYYYLPPQKSHVAPADRVADPRTVAFHRKIWSTFSGWIKPAP